MPTWLGLGNQAEVVDWVRANPGSSWSAINAATRCSNTTLWNAWRTGKLRREGERGHYRYWARDA